MSVYHSHNVDETFKIASELGAKLKNGDVVAYFGSMGMGKTTFTRGLAHGLGISEAQVSSPTFALVHEYKGEMVRLCHFDMYRISTWDDLYSTGYFEYLDSDAILAVEWSENIENALPDNFIKISISKGENENDRIIEISGENLQ